jgi:DNA replication protein DnaC
MAKRKAQNTSKPSVEQYRHVDLGRDAAEKYWRHARIPPLYWEAELPESGAIAGYAVNIQENLKNGIGILLVGPNGVGKTYASVAIAKKALEFTARVLYIPAPDLVQAYIHEWMFDEDVTMAAAFRTRSLLVIDDVGQEYRGSGSGYSEQNLVNLIRYRITYRRATVLTTNMNPEQLRETYGNGFASLLQQGMVIVQMNGKDRRREGREELLEKSGVKGG